MELDLSDILKNTPHGQMVDKRTIALRERTAKSSQRVISEPSIYTPSTGFPRVRIKTLKKIFAEEGLLRDSVSRINVMESFAVKHLKDGVDKEDLEIIGRSLALAEVVIEKDTSFSIEFLQSIVHLLSEFSHELLEKDEVEKGGKILKMLDIILGIAENRVGKKDGLSRDEKDIYAILGDSNVTTFKAPIPASRFYKVGIERGSQKCHIRLGVLIETYEERSQEALEVYRQGWMKYKDIRCLERAIMLLFEMGKNEEAYSYYQIYKKETPSTDLIYNFLPAINPEHAYGAFHKEIELFHEDPERGSLGPKIAYTIRETSLKDINEKKQHLADLVPGSGAYEALATDILLTLQNGVFGILSRAFLEPYLSFLEEMLTSPGGPLFVRSFFEEYSVEHVRKVVSAGEFDGDENHPGTSVDSSVHILNQFIFLLYHFAPLHDTDSFQSLIDRSLALIVGMGLNKEEYTQSFIAGLSRLCDGQENFNSLPDDLQSEIRILRDSLYGEERELYLRKTLYQIVVGFGSTNTQDCQPEQSAYIILLHLIFSPKSIIDSIVENLNFSVYSDHSIVLFSRILYYLGHWIEAAQIALNHGNTEDIKLLEIICDTALTHTETIESMQKFFSLNFPDTPSLSSYINSLLQEKKDIPELQRVFGISLWIDLKDQSTEFSDEVRAQKIEQARGTFKSSHHGFTLQIQSAQNAGNQESLIAAKTEYADAFIRFAAFLMDSEEKKEAYVFLQDIFSYSADPRVLQYLADLSLEFNLREDAHKFITLMDDVRFPTTSSFWIEYYFSSTSSDDKLKALHIFLASEEGTLVGLSPSTSEALLAYAHKRYHVLETLKGYDAEFLHLSHYLSTDLTQDLLMAVSYWERVAIHIQNEDLELLNEHFRKYVPLEEYDMVTPKMSHHQFQLHTLCVSLRHQSRSFFDVFQNIPHTENLGFAIMSAFRAIPGSLGSGFAEDFEIYFREQASDKLKRLYPDKIISSSTMLQ